jgi:Haem-binding domain
MRPSTSNAAPGATSGEQRGQAHQRWAAARPVVIRTALVSAIAFGLMQLVPYGWTHDNPPVGRDAPWPDVASEQIARTSCYSCHSNETNWPAYSYVAPMSWLVRADVDRGRDEFNFSDWDAGDADDAIEQIEEGSMPLGRYLLIHRDARLSPTESATLIAALEAMSGDDHRGRDGDGDD